MIYFLFLHVSHLCLCNKLPKIQQLEDNKYLLSYNFCGQESRQLSWMSLPQGLSWGSCWLGLKAPTLKAWLRGPKGGISCQANSCGLLGGLESSSTGLPYDMATSFPYSEWSKKEQEKKQSTQDGSHIRFFYNLVSVVTSHDFCHTWFVRTGVN